MRDAVIRRNGALLAAASALAVFVAATAHACSICRCGDPTFNALGTAGYASPGFRPAVDWERFDKDEGDPGQAAESQVENRVTALFSCGVSDAFALFARVPYSVRDLTASAPSAEADKTHTSGLSDPEIYGQLRLWSSPFAGGMGRRAAVSLLGGVKTPWGRNDLRQDGERLDEHAQPGTGSTDVFGSLSLLYLIDARSALFAAAGYRHTGENDFAYRYGESYLGNVAYEHKLGRVFDAVCELDFRHAAKDRTDSAGTLDGDTGGSLLYATPRLLVDLGGGAVLRLASQIPIARDLNGAQKEKAVLNVGMTYLFSH